MNVNRSVGAAARAQNVAILASDGAIKCQFVYEFVMQVLLSAK